MAVRISGQSGQKYYIAVGKEYDVYLQVNPSGEGEDGQNLLSGVKDKHNASLFRVDQSDDKYVLAYGDGEDMMFMARNLPSDPTGMFSLQIGGGDVLEFTLHTPGPGDAATDLKTWREKPCYIKFEGGYAAYNADKEVFEFTEGSSDDKSHWYRCQLKQPKEAEKQTQAQVEPRVGRRAGPVAARKAPIFSEMRPVKGKNQARKKKPKFAKFGTE